MKARIAAVAICAAALAVGVIPNADAGTATPAASGGRIACVGVRLADVGICVHNPLP